MSNIETKKSAMALTLRSQNIISRVEALGVRATTLKQFKEVSTELETCIAATSECAGVFHLKKVRGAKLEVARALTVLRALATLGGPDLTTAFRSALTITPRELKSRSEVDCLARTQMTMANLMQLPAPDITWNTARKQLSAAIESLAEIGAAHRASQAAFVTSRAELRAMCARWHRCRLALRAELVLHDSVNRTSVTAVVFPPQRRRKRGEPAEVTQPASQPAQPSTPAAVNETRPAAAVSTPPEK